MIQESQLHGVIAQIPAREGSKRVLRKNLRYLAGKPMYQYSIETALKVNSIDRVVANSDCDSLLRLAEDLGAETYKRPFELANDQATGDDFTLDFIKKFTPETLVLINPACPLIDHLDVEHALQTFNANPDADTLITANVTRMPTFLESEPINISLSEAMQPTQNNKRVITLNWAIAIWNTKMFLENVAAQGHAYLGRKRILHQIPEWRSVKISDEDDFELADLLLTSMRLKKEKEILYWEG